MPAKREPEEHGMAVGNANVPFQHNSPVCRQRPYVIPAKAGIHAFILEEWIPAFAGMTL